MNFRRAGGLMLATASTLAFGDCRGRTALAAHAAPPAAAAGAAGRAPAAAPVAITAADRDAYERGRRRELALTRAALDRLSRAGPDSARRAAAVAAAAPALMEGEGAAAAGLEVARYRALVSRMDVALRERAWASDSRGGDGGPGSGDAWSAEWRLLDSLRVELAVLRSRFDAAAPADRGGGVAP